jgi:ribosomal protein S12 methylthiotransferase
MLLQQQISLEKNQDMLGKEIKVLVEEVSSLRVVCRSFRDAPEIDGQVYIDLNEDDISPALGEFVTVKISACDEYDLFAELI